jgi:formate dehydrogenase major subunit
LQWPCPHEDHPGTQILHTDIPAGNRRVSLRRVDYRPTDERTTPDFTLLLSTGRSLYQFNAGTMTGRSRAGRFRPTDLLAISGDDARELHIDDGDRVRVRSRYGEIALVATLSETVARGQLFATFQSPDVFVNRLTSHHRDAFVHTPEYKVIAVSVEPLAPPR